MLQYPIQMKPRICLTVLTLFTLCLRSYQNLCSNFYFDMNRKNNDSNKNFTFFFDFFLKQNDNKKCNRVDEIRE